MVANERFHLHLHEGGKRGGITDRKSTRLNSSHSSISYAVFCLKKTNNSHSDRSPRAGTVSVTSRIICTRQHQTTNACQGTTPASDATSTCPATTTPCKVTTTAG